MFNKSLSKQSTHPGTKVSNSWRLTTVIHLGFITQVPTCSRPLQITMWIWRVLLSVSVCSISWLFSSKSCTMNCLTMPIIILASTVNLNNWVLYCLSAFRVPGLVRPIKPALFKTVWLITDLIHKCCVHQKQVLRLGWMPWINPFYLVALYDRISVVIIFNCFVCYLYVSRICLFIFNIWNDAVNNQDSFCQLFLKCSTYIA